MFDSWDNFTKGVSQATNGFNFSGGGGQSQIINDPGGAANRAGSAFHHAYFNPSGPPPIPAPPVPPSLGEVTQGNLENNVSLERNMRAQSALYGSGAGLTDAPMTASRTLLGN